MSRRARRSLRRKSIVERCDFVVLSGPGCLIRLGVLVETEVESRRTYFWTYHLVQRLHYPLEGTFTCLFNGKSVDQHLASEQYTAIKSWTEEHLTWLEVNEFTMRRSLLIKIAFAIKSILIMGNLLGRYSTGRLSDRLLVFFPAVISKFVLSKLHFLFDSHTVTTILSLEDSPTSSLSNRAWMRKIRHSSHCFHSCASHWPAFHRLIVRSSRRVGSTHLDVLALWVIDLERA